MLLNASSNTLFAYNNVASQIWDLMQEGHAERGIASALAAAWGIPAARARDDVSAIIALWRRQGLLADGVERPRPAPSAAANRPAAVSSAATEDWVCNINGTSIAFSIGDDLLRASRALFRHLEMPDAEPQTLVAMTRMPSGEIALTVDGRERLRTDDPAVAIGTLFIVVLECIRPGMQWFALLHGAALARRGHGLALAGPPGAGKSTLAAGLMAAGFDYLADDVVALSAPDALLVPLPLPLSLKPGSFDTLSRRFPQLATAPRYRTKGTDARLLLPDPNAWDAQPQKLRALFFPRFVPGSAPQLHPLSSFEALQNLLMDRVWIGDPITEQRVTTFLAWLTDTPAYGLSYGTLDDAISLVEGVVP